MKMGVKRTRARRTPEPVVNKYGTRVEGNFRLSLEQEYDERGNLQPVKVLRFSAFMNGKDITPANYERWVLPTFGTLTERDHDHIRYYTSKRPYSDDCEIWLNQPYEHGRLLRRDSVTVVAQPGNRSSEHYVGPPSAGESIFLSPNLTTKTRV